MRSHLALAVIGVAVLASNARCEQHYFNSNGVTIAYFDEGDGEAIVLLHGFSVSAAEMWTKKPFVQSPIISALAKEYRVLAPDLRGHGNSDKPHDPNMYGREIAEDVVRLLDHLNVAKAHVVGYSMGATVAGNLLVKHSDRLLSVTFAGGGPLLCPSKAASDIMTATADSLERGDGLGPLLIALTPEGQPKPGPAYADLISKWALQGKDQKALAAVIRGQSSLAVTGAELAANRVPVAFVYGSREAAWKLHLITRVQCLLRQAHVTVVDGGDHISTVGSAEFLEAMLNVSRAHRQQSARTFSTSLRTAPAASDAGR